MYASRTNASPLVSYLLSDLAIELPTGNNGVGARRRWLAGRPALGWCQPVSVRSRGQPLAAASATMFMLPVAHSMVKVHPGDLQAVGGPLELVVVAAADGPDGAAGRVDEHVGALHVGRAGA